MATCLVFGTAMAAGSGFAQSPSSTDWGTEHSALTSTPEFAKSKAICRRLSDLAPPAHDQPSSAQTEALRGCSSEKLYYGEGVRPDYVKARLCAFTEADGDDVFSGPTILMQVYANGLGVARDLDLATSYACAIDGAPAEIDGRVLHLQALKTKAGRFDYCDDITSGAAEGFCQERDSDRGAIGRDARLKELAARLPDGAKKLYPPMKKAFDAFVDAHGDGEVDQSGTARAAEVIAEEDNTRDQFTADLQRLLDGRWISTADAEAADVKLNASYRRAIAWAAGKDNLTTVKLGDVRTAERAWLAYRDAFVGFAAVAAPAVGRDAVLARLTRLRTAQLDQLWEE